MDQQSLDLPLHPMIRLIRDQVFWILPPENLSLCFSTPTINTWIQIFTTFHFDLLSLYLTPTIRSHTASRLLAVKFKSDGVPILWDIINGCPLSVEFFPTLLLLLAYNIA